MDTPDHDGWMLYGATGYTGVLLAEEAKRRGLRPLLAGRSESKLKPLAERLGMPFRAVGLDDPKALRDSLTGVRAVLHVAGPFVDTSEPMVRACLDVKAHYLDLTGERSVFHQVLNTDAEARARGVCLISGVGFDVVPSDCLAKHVADRVSGGAHALEIALVMVGRPSAGTAKSLVGFIHEGTWVRRGGVLQRVPFGRGVRKVRFPQRESWTMPMNLADLETAYRTTGAPDITVRLAIPSSLAGTLRAAWPLFAAGAWATRPLFASTRIQRALRDWVDAHVQGADEARRARTRTFAWARAHGASGDETQAWLECPDAYDFTAHSALNATLALLERASPGAITPALAFGADFPLTVPGVRRLDTLPDQP
ncbi:MAG TPA: saccharopine dehydrogenase NADP-binding domain-containing protein [Myxococcaceae bacterium]|nr:saccharopine dehydrogenase NADP-binding domain-containing protein [Myxococcaceae bacterium]